MKIIYFLQNHSINLPEIWSDCSIYVCLWLVSIVLLAIWSANNYKQSIKKEYEEKKDSSIHSLNHLVDKLESENSYLKQAFDSYKYDTQKELIELRNKLPKRNSDGTFAVKTGKGHGKKKAEKDWIKATKEELFEEAKRRYHVGTKIKSMFGIGITLTITDNNFTMFKTSNNKYQNITVSTDFGNGNHVKNGCSIYSDGKWAEIIK